MFDYLNYLVIKISHDKTNLKILKDLITFQQVTYSLCIKNLNKIKRKINMSRMLIKLKAIIRIPFLK